ncbi:hypothetical protein HK104_007185 [Borealophlyctis nickersoniae]|nr:hypothetical protein HK104_007185 [Borealophlyctis nickersoniae]
MVPRSNHSRFLLSLSVSSQIINRVISGYNLVEEAILTIVHEDVIDWLLPNVKATRRRIVIPMCTCVSFNEEGRITSKRIYWEQASVLKQISALPASVFCKANNSETTLPVLGNQIAIKLCDNDSVVNIAYDEEQQAAAAAEVEPVQSYRNRVPATSILPVSQDADEVQPIRSLTKRASASSIVPVAEEEPIRTGRARPASVALPRSAVSLILGDDEGPTTDYVRPSTRIHFQPGGKPSNIFDDVPLPKPTNKRDPNWSSVSAGLRPGDVTVSGKRTFEGRSTESHFAIGDEARATQDAMGTVAANHGRKHSERTHENSNIFGSPQDPYANRRTGRRDPNARSEELGFSRPSSRVMRPPGGGSSFSIA